MIAGCQSEVKAPMPMEEDKAIKVLSDVRIIDEIVRKHEDADRDSVGRVLTDSLYSIHAIDSSQLVNLYKYLQANIRQHHAIEKMVHKNLKNYLDDL